MAFTRIHPIKATLNYALDYIENPIKTEEQLLVSGYNVDPLCASLEFKMTAALAEEIAGDYTRVGGSENLAYHMIQSFSPYDKITPEEAHRIGKEFADEVLQGRYEYVISTHVDKGHIHNHIIFNAVSFYDYHRYDSFNKARQLRQISDRLCEENGLYVIQNPNLARKGLTHQQWQGKKRVSYREQLRGMIDSAIAGAADYREFLSALAAVGVEVKDGKRISFRIANSDQERFCRGDRMGDAYSKEKLLERLAVPMNERQKPASEATQTLSEGNMVFPGYGRKVAWEARKTTLAATRELAATLVTIRQECIEGENDFDTRLSALDEKRQEVRGTLSRLDAANLQYKVVAKYLLTFRQMSAVVQESERLPAWKAKRFAAEHAQQFRMYEQAVSQLETLGVNTNVDPQKVTALVQEQDTRAADLNRRMQRIEQRITALRQAQAVVRAIQMQQEHMPQAQKKDKAQNR